MLMCSFKKAKQKKQPLMSCVQMVIVVTWSYHCNHGNQQVTRTLFLSVCFFFFFSSSSSQSRKTHSALAATELLIFWINYSQENEAQQVLHTRTQTHTDTDLETHTETVPKDWAHHHNLPFPSDSYHSGICYLNLKLGVKLHNWEL